MMPTWTTIAFRVAVWVCVCLALGHTEDNTLHVDITISGEQERVYFAPHTDVQALAKRVRSSLPRDAISGDCTADCIEARLAEAMRIETSAALLDLPARPRRRPLHVALDAVAANLTAHGEREYGAFVSALGAWPWAHERKSSLGDSLRWLAPARRADLAVEFGVASGHSLGMIAAALPSARVVGFDSFEGLPEAWGHHEAGAFATRAEAVAERLPQNVELVVGRFERTVARWWADECAKLRERGSDGGVPLPRLSLVHLDADLYSSTKVALDVLAPVLRDGVLVVADELLQYPGFERHELRALYEFAREHDRHLEWLALWTPHEDALFEWGQPISASLRVW